MSAGVGVGVQVAQSSGSVQQRAARSVQQRTQRRSTSVGAAANVAFSHATPMHHPMSMIALSMVRISNCTP